MPESVERFFTSEFGIACAAGLGLLVAGWLVVSYLTPGRARTSIEWGGALGLYVALLSFFTYHSLHAWQGDHTIRLMAFGLLATLFGSGALVTLVHLLKSFGAAGGPKDGATN